MSVTMRPACHHADSSGRLVELHDAAPNRVADALGGFFECATRYPIGNGFVAKAFAGVFEDAVPDITWVGVDPQDDELRADAQSADEGGSRVFHGGYCAVWGCCWSTVARIFATVVMGASKPTRFWDFQSCSRPERTS